MSADPPVWLACSRCGATARRIDEFLAHVRECQGERVVVDVEAVVVTARTSAADAQAGALQAAPEARPPRPRAKTGRPPGARALRLSQAERWVSVRDRYPGATLKEIAASERVSLSAVCWWRKAAIDAGLEEDRNWRARGQKIVQARRPKRERQASPSGQVKEPKAPSTKPKRKSMPKVTAQAPKRALVAAAVEAVDAMAGATARASGPLPAPTVRPAAKVLPPAPKAAAPREVPALNLTERQAEIAQGLYDGRVLLIHLDVGDAWWEDVGRGAPGAGTGPGWADRAQACSALRLRAVGADPAADADG